jgi:nucleoside-triphosphatase
VPGQGHVLLLTGRPGAGKTTVLRTVAGNLPRSRIGGFYTEEIRTAGGRQGFRLVTFDGRGGILADVRRPGGPRVGKYGVDLAVLDDLASLSLTLRDEIDLYLVDEIGKMECLSPGFTAAMRALLDSTKPVVATVALRGGGLIAEVKARRDVLVWEVTRGNRDELPDRIVTWLGHRRRA